MPSNNKEGPIQTSLKLIAKSSFIVFIGIILSKIFGYLFRIIIARSFGPEIYGLFSLGMAISGFFVSVFGLGLAEGLLRYIPILRGKNKNKEVIYLINTTIKVYIVFGIIGTIISYLSSEIIANQLFHDPSLVPIIRIFSVSMLIYMLQSVFLVVIRSFERVSTYSFLYNILQNLLRVVLLSFFVLIGLKSNGNYVVLSFALSALIVLVVAYLIVKKSVIKEFNLSKYKKFPKLRKEFFSYSWPIIFSSVIGLIFTWIDSFSLAYYKSSYEVGLYNAAIPIAMIITFIPDLFMQLFSPMITRMYAKKDYSLIEQISKQVTKWIFILILPFSIIILFFPGAALNILFGRDFLLAENALRILLITYLIYSVSSTLPNMITMLGKSRLILLNIVITSILNLVLNSIFIPMKTILFMDNSLGIVGAALATLISVFLLNLMLLIEIRLYFPFIPLRKKMINIGIIGLISLIILFYVKDLFESNLTSMILVSLLFFLVYIFLIFISKSFDENDIYIFKKIVRKLFKRISIKE